MFYLTSKFHDNRVNTFGFMERGGASQELQKSPGGLGLTTSYRPDFTFYKDYFLFLSSLRTLKYSCNNGPLPQSVERGVNNVNTKVASSEHISLFLC